MSHFDLLSELSPLGLGHRLELGFGEIAKNIWNAQAAALAIGFVIAAVAPIEALGQTDIGALTVVSRQAKPKKTKTAHARAPQRPPARRAERRTAPAGRPASPRRRSLRHRPPLDAIEPTAAEGKVQRQATAAAEASEASSSADQVGATDGRTPIKFDIRH
ncbi:hypothetical protein IY145_06530 [Methylosinus sp. H3A]|uniref:hypothetical protein n=1 Tax=Methylosinus sp. H3A TaxID=2785786 RepID=UPI0018C2537E|nr:hypothetical protein [Methylosinus sp. H3A]MBG0809028.1 hypothetical protein [Methylosinus sp. H3A]